jgi:hypothetical protein
MYILYYSLLILGISIYSFLKERTKNDFSKVKRLTNFFVIYPLKIIAILFILYGIKKLLIEFFLVAFEKSKRKKASVINKYIYSDAYFVSMILLYSFIGPKNFAFFIFFFILSLSLYNIILNETNPDANISLFPYVMKYPDNGWMRFLLVLYIIVILPIIAIILSLATYAILFLYVISIGE